MRITKLIRTIGGTAVVAVVFAFLTFGAASRVMDTSPDTKLIAGVNFSLTASITAQPACSGPTVLLHPGATRCLTYTVDNPLPDAITVTSISAAVDPAFPEPAECPASNVDLSAAGFNGSPAFVVAGGGSGSVHKQITLTNTASNQDACQNVTFHFKYSGTATYVHVYSTSTALSSSPNPSIAGNVFTLTATVTTPSQTPPGSPTGAVTFKDGSTTIACGAGSTPLTTSVATCKYSTFVVGPHAFQATYSNTPPSGPPDGNFSGSSSNVLTHTVNYSSCITGNLNTDLVVSSGQAICVTGKVNGTATVQSGGALYVNGGSVNNNIVVQSGGALFVNANADVNGSITATSPLVVDVCGAKKVNGGISVSGSPNLVLIGDGTSSCGGNDINGSVTLTNNTGGYKVVGNKINGSVTVTGNSGTGIISKNTKINGDLTCSGNSPAPTNGGQPNSVNGTRSGQCGAANF